MSYLIQGIKKKQQTFVYDACLNRTDLEGGGNICKKT